MGGKINPTTLFKYLKSPDYERRCRDETEKAIALLNALTGEEWDRESLSESARRAYHERIGHGKVPNGTIWFVDKDEWENEH